MTNPPISRGVHHRGSSARKHLGWLAIFLAISLLLIPACQPGSQTNNASKGEPTAPSITTGGPLASPAPGDQRGALLPGFPPIPANLTHYILRVDLDYAGQVFTLDAGVEYTNTEGVDLESLYFRLYPNYGQSFGNGSINILSTLVDGQPAETRMSLFNSIEEVRLPEVLKAGGHLRIDFKASGKVPSDFGGKESGSGYGMYNYSQGVLALADFYPMLAVYSSGSWALDPVYGYGDSVFSDAALYTVEVLAVPSLTLATSGIQLSQAEVGNKLLYRYVSGPARDFAIIASPDFQVESLSQGGTTVNSYYLPDHAGAGAQALRTAARALEIYSSTFGGYPYRTYSVVEAPLNRPSGIEYPAMGLIATRLYADPSNLDFDTTVAHEAAHQWWYGVVGNDVIRAPWMDEALASYSSIYYWEQVGGQDAKGQILAYYQEKFDQNIQAGLDAPVTEPMAFFLEGSRSQSYSPVVYAKGALFYYNLRQAIGDVAFVNALKFYYGTHWFKNANSGELLTAFQNATQVQLDGLFQTWLYSPELSTSTPTASPAPTSTPTPTATPELTSTPTPVPEPLVFAAIGDYGGGDSGEEAVADLIKSWQPELIITLGDNNYPVGARDHIDQAIGQYFHSYIFPYWGSYGSGADKNRFFPVIGNHDMQSEYGQPYYDYFTLPGNERYYDFVWGPVHFFALDSLDSEPDGVGASSVQADWLKQRLAESTSPWNLVYMHYPPYSSGLHGSIDWMRWPYGEWGADIVLAGHDHTYERLSEDGMTYFVNGMGGYDTYDFPDILNGSQKRYVDDFGAMRIEATQDEITFEFINVKNEVIDSYTQRK